MLRTKPHLKLNIVFNKYFLTHDDLSNLEKNFLFEILLRKYASNNFLSKFFGLKSINNPIFNNLKS